MNNISYEKKVRACYGLGVWRVGGDVKYPIYVVAEEGDGSRGKILHTLSGRWARENAMKRFRWLAFGIPYREFRTQLPIYYRA